MSGGGILSRRTGTLSSDGKLLFCPCGKQLHIHSAVTGERVGSISGHAAEVTGVLLNPDSDDQVYTFSMDGTFRRWDFRSGEELQKVTAAAPIKHMVIQRALGVAYLSIYHREGGGRVVLYDMKQGKFSGTAMRTRSTGPLALSSTGSLCATVDKHSLFVWRTGTDVHQPLNLTHTKPYTCVAFSSDDSVLAAGDMSGRILIYRSFHHHVPSARREGEHSGKHHPTSPPPLTTVHWHAHPVGCLAFSPDGTYLLSGGAEGVLVLWTLETNRPNFLPRLGGPLIGIHPSPADPARYVLRQADNVVRIVNTATMKVEASIMGLRPPPLGLAPPAGVGGGGAAVLAPGRGAGGAGGGGSAGVLVVPCENAQLQFYDVARDRHVALVQVAPRNAVSLSDTNPYGSHSPFPGGGRRGGRGAQAAQPDPSASTVPPFVALVALSGDGSAMATVDLRPDGGPYGSTEACLKFWDATSSSGSSEAGSGGFLLNTRVDEPHRDHVACLAYHPTRHVAVTTGGSGAESEYKLWVREQRSSPASGRRGAGRVVGSHWRCLATGGYKGLPLGPAAFSPGDGSVLAVAAHSRVTLWDSSSSALAAVLPAPPADEHRVASGPSAAAPLTQLAFVPGTPFLAAASATSLTVYNILTAAVHWSLPYGAVSISADPLYGLLAAALPATPPLPAEAPAAADAAPSASKPAGNAAAAAAPVVIPVPPSCHVLVLDPRDATPRYHCHVPGARAVHLAHLTTSSAAAAADGKGCSPLLMLRDNRQYSIAALEGSEDSAVQGLAAAGLSLAKEQEPNAFEAAFGKQTAAAAAGAGAGQGSEGPSAMEVDGATVGGKPRWAELFDAPSHVLPPPSALASAFLTLLTTAHAGGNS